MSERLCVICGTALARRKQTCGHCKRRRANSARRREFNRVLRKYGLLREDIAA